MTAIERNYTIEKGATWSVGWQVKYNGDFIDETWTARGQVRKNAASPTVLYDLDPTVNSDGSVVVGAEPDTSTDWTWKEGKYDVEVESPDGVVLRIVEGTLRVSPEVTR